ncbi:MAG: hypothetical protein GY938_18975 [Ketobacter sp.]|nr:hypothetical protein [Ketobacter sp.]
MLENSGLEGDNIAGWLASPYFKYDDAGHETPALFGEIHLTDNDFDAGWFAHELQHFILDFIDRFKLDFADKDNEVICTIVGEMTTAFWGRFYELYEEDEG